MLRRSRALFQAPSTALRTTQLVPTATPKSTFSRHGKILVPKTPALVLRDNAEQLRQFARASDGRFQQAAPAAAQLATATARKPNYTVMDGNTAAAHVAYATSEISFIYPISPATSMGEKMDEWATARRNNVFGQNVSVNMMQSEAGSAGALHGAAAAGALTSTFTASQGLLLMIPNMYLLAGELVPTVFHVAARSVSKHALSIFNDHSDVMSVRQTGFAMLCSASVQEVMDLGLVAHISSVKARLPFVHFFDGYRTSAEMQKIDAIQYEEIAKIYPHEELKKNLLTNALNPTHPRIRGTQMRPDIFMQVSLAAHQYYRAAPAIIEEVMKQVGELTGRHYNLFDYYGSPTADRVAVLMGSASKTTQETVDYLNSQGENVGVITTRLFRPWSAEHFYRVLPESARKIAVMDRTREEGASGCPLFLDVSVTLGDRNDVRLVTGGQYGLASKEFTPPMAKAAFDNLNEPNPKMRYVIGVEDDVTKTSLTYSRKPLNTVPQGTTQCMLFGVGGDGMVGASQNMIQLISDYTDLNAQGHFVYDSKKTDGLTTSHLRFGPKPINSSYCVTEGASLVMCSHPSYVNKFDFMLDSLVQGGIFVLNSPWGTLEEMERKLPAWFKRQIAEKEAEFYTIDATKVADEVGLGKKRVNNILSACFWHLSGVLPQEKAVGLLKDSIHKMYKHKGPQIVRMNQNGVDEAISHKVRVNYNREAWLSAVDHETEATKDLPDYVQRVTNPVLAMKGDHLPVSAFEPGGSQPTGTTAFERRGLAPEIPVWDADKCTQCNYCAIVCPHAVIRPFLLDKQEVKGVPEGFEHRKAKGGSEVAGYNYTIKIAPMDCTGCAVCVESCPDDALLMAPFQEAAPKADPWWEYAMGLSDKGEIGDKFTVKGSQFQKPLLEFSAACSGCGETPYVKLATQLFGERMMIANATGCSSIWGSVATAIPYTKNEKGFGPAWGSSLFEDNAEYGLGMMVGMRQRRQRLAGDIETALATVEMPEKLREGFDKWLQYNNDHEKCDVFTNIIQHELHELPQPMDPMLKAIMDREDILRTTSQWIIGGDGWAYDIGFGGLDHVLSLSGENVNLMVLDTEMYSNTGGQMSKSTPLAAVVKYASSGKPKTKKNLALHAINYEHVYVASVALGASYAQCVQAMKEAESYQGPSLVLAYSPCIDWGFDMKHMMDVQKQAVDCGYWTLYRYDPRRVAEGLNPFQLDSKRVRSDLSDWIKGQNRFARLVREQKDRAVMLQTQLKDKSMELHHKYEHMAMDDEELLGELMEKMGVTSQEFLDKEKSIILYGTETGNAHTLADVFKQELKRRGVEAKVEAMDDMDVEDLVKYKNVYCVVSTAGQGEFPANAHEFWKGLSNTELPNDLLKETRFAVFGLGDSGYVYFNQAAKRFDQRFEELGAQRVVTLGLGDDKDDEKYETQWADWHPVLWEELGTPPPTQELLPPSYHVQLDANIKAPTEPYLSPGATFLPLLKNELLTPPEYDRIIRHYEFDIRSGGFQYSVGDCLGIHAHNKVEDVENFLINYGVKPDAVCLIEDTLARKNPLPAVMTAGQLFTEILDIFGRPTRRFYETLSMVAADDKEKEELLHLLTKEGHDLYQQNIKETVTYADLLRKYPSTQMSLDYLIDFIPIIKPRLYSIASSCEMFPEIIQLCIVKDDWVTPSKRYREGLCTRHIETKSLDPSQPVDHLPCRLSAAGINIPDSQRPPYVMVALGTGIAPMRSMVQEREVARLGGETVGEMAMFFGARYKATDYTYGDEFDEFHSNGKGVLTFLSNAFSRDQEYKIYVQNRIDENPEVVYDYLVKKGGYFYLCGPAGNVPPAVRKAVCNAIVKCGGHKPEEADQMVTQMQIEGRYNVEAW